MINITYSPSDAQIAEQMQNDLSAAGVRLDNDVLIVLVTSDALADDTVRHAISRAQDEGHVIVPVMLEKTALPDDMQPIRALYMTNGYRKQKLIPFLQQADVSAETRSSNRRLLFYVGAAALSMFIISLGAIGSGFVAFPEDEYATENAIREQQINTIVAPQLEELRPRTTQDALEFDSTLEAIGNEDLLPFVIGTATAIPESIQATNEARATSAFATDSAATETAGE